MDESLRVPTATSFRTMPAKLLEVNRTIINNQLRRLTHLGKVSFTHLIGWAVVEAMAAMPDLNVAYHEMDAVPHVIKHAQVNLGIAIDVPRRDGSRSLLVPNIKAADAMTFRQYWEAYEEIVEKVRDNAVTPEDFFGTTDRLPHQSRNPRHDAIGAPPHAGSRSHRRRRRHRPSTRVPRCRRALPGSAGDRTGGDPELHV